MTATRILFVTTALLFAALPLSHASVYVKAAGLYNRPNDIEVSNASAFKASLKNNVGFSAAVGYKLSLLRLEAEGQFLRNRAESNTTSGTLLGGVISTAGTIKESTGFVNALVDLPTFFRLTPYI